MLHRLNQFLSPNYRLGQEFSQENQSKSDSKWRKRSNSDSRLGDQSSLSSRLEQRYSYDSRLDYYSSHSPSWTLSECRNLPVNPSSNSQEEKSADNISRISLDYPSMGFSDVSIVIDSLDQEIPKMDDLATNIPDILVCNNDQDDEATSVTQGNWIGLEPQNKILLSPRSSNGSICSFRSSNADSAIEILTPEEEISDMQDFPHHSETWESDLVGKSENVPVTNQEFVGYEKSQLSDMWRQVMFNKSKSSQSKRCNDQTQTDTQTLESFSSTENSACPSNIIQPPSVIISDYSTQTFEDKGSQTEGPEGRGSQTEGAEGAGSLQDQLDFMDRKYLSFPRCASSSSISSTDTSLSFQSDSSQDVDLESGANGKVSCTAKI